MERFWFQSFGSVDRHMLWTVTSLQVSYPVQIWRKEDELLSRKRTSTQDKQVRKRMHLCDPPPPPPITAVFIRFTSDKNMITALIFFSGWTLFKHLLQMQGRVSIFSPSFDVTICNHVTHGLGWIIISALGITILQSFPHPHGLLCFQYHTSFYFPMGTVACGLIQSKRRRHEHYQTRKKLWVWPQRHCHLRRGAGDASISAEDPGLTGCTGSGTESPQE